MASFKRLVTVNTIVEEDSIFGQQAVLDAIVVGAVIVNSPRDVRDYSSQGPSTIYTNFSTQASVQRDSLDAVGTDGVQTAIGQPPHWRAIFNGTSAAAPHVAAVAALLLDGKPQLSPTEIDGIFHTSSDDIESSGYDIVSGYGRVDALEAILDAKVWQNPSNRYGVSGDGSVSSIDSVRMINWINNNGSSTPLPNSSVLGPPDYYDVDGDNDITTNDRDLVINCVGSGICP